MKKSILPAFILLPLGLAGVSVWLVFWMARSLLFWGVGSSAVRAAVGVSVALACMAAVLIKPIPIKGAAVAALYLFLFSVFGSLLGLAAHDSAALDGGLLAIFLTFAALIYGRLHGRRVRITRYTLPGAGVGLRIGLVSDIHMGLTMDPARLRRQCERLAKYAPELLIIAGDVTDERTSPEDMRDAFSILGGVPAPLGVYYVFGNHELPRRGPKPKYTKAGLLSAINAAGIRILADERVTVGGVSLIGRRDASISGDAERLPLAELLKGAPTELPVVVADHQPRSLGEAVEGGAFLLLSGHTHAGQVWPMGILARLLRVFPVTYGHKRVGSTNIIVSSGLGNRGSRLRSGCTAELVIIDLEE